MTAEPAPYTEEWARKVYGPNSPMVQHYAQPKRQIIVERVVVKERIPAPPAPLPPPRLRERKQLLRDKDGLVTGVLVEQLDAAGQVVSGRQQVFTRDKVTGVVNGIEEVTL